MHDSVDYQHLDKGINAYVNKLDKRYTHLKKSTMMDE